MLLALAREKKVILLTTLGATLAAVVIVLLIPRMYTAKTTLLPPKETESSAGALSGQLSALNAVRIAAMSLGDNGGNSGRFLYSWLAAVN